MKEKKQKFIDKVDEGFRYFDGYRLEELKEDGSIFEDGNEGTLL